MPVVAAPGGLGDDGPSELRAEGAQLVGVPAGAPARAGQAEPVAEALAHEQLVLGVDEGGRAGPDEDPGRLEPGEEPGGHVLVVEGDDVAAGGELPDDGRVGEVADGHLAHDPGGTHVGALGEQPHLEIETDRRLVHHAGQLPTPDDPDRVRRIHGSNPNDGHEKMGP